MSATSCRLTRRGVPSAWPSTSAGRVSVAGRRPSDGARPGTTLASRLDLARSAVDVSPHIEIGQYFATAKLGDHYEYAGSRTKCHFGIAATDDWPVRLGGNVELDYMRFAAEDQPLTLEHNVLFA